MRKLTALRVPALKIMYFLFPYTIEMYVLAWLDLPSRDLEQANEDDRKLIAVSCVLPSYHVVRSL